MKKSTCIFGAALTGSFLLLFACTKQSTQAIYDKQESSIDAFVQARLKADTSATVTYNSGSVRVTMHDTLYAKGQGDSLSAGGMVSMYYAGYVLNGTSVSSQYLFATNHAQTASDAGWSLTDTTVLTIKNITLDDTLLEGLRLGLEGVQAQDECYILFNGSFAYGNKVQGTIPARSALVYHVWVNSIDNDIENNE